MNRSMSFLLAIAVFAGAGTIHYQTPLLGAFGVEFHADTAAVGWVATLTFGGFLAGMVFLVPLGDRIDKRKLILGQLAGVIVALLGMAAAPSLAALAALSFVTGVCASFAQSIVPLTAELARPEERGRSVAAVLTALFLGILFARVASGLVATALGWRWVYVLAALMLIALAPALVMRLPSTRPTTQLSYPALIASLVHLVRANPELRHASVIQLLIGISYGGFWATMAPMLLMFHGLGPTQAGLMAIPGAAGVLVTRRAGRWMDRRGTYPVVATGIGLVLAAYIVFALAPVSIFAVVAGAILLDCGLRSAMVANQTLVNSVAPDARSRFNTVFGAHVWGGNAAGAFLASMALAHLGWLAVCAIAASASLCALALQWRARRTG
jgi:predicted MFS family arabinose efflux permease